jgi:hypothetical protein
VCCNSCHGNAVVGVRALYILCIYSQFGDHLRIMDFGHFVIIFMMCVITVVIVMLISENGRYGLIFMTVCFHDFGFSSILDGLFTSPTIKCNLSH